MYKWSKFNQNLQSFQKPKFHYIHTEFETIRAAQKVQYSFNDGHFNSYHEQNEGGLSVNINNDNDIMI